GWIEQADPHEVSVARRPFPRLVERDVVHLATGGAHGAVDDHATITRAPSRRPLVEAVVERLAALLLHGRGLRRAALLAFGRRLLRRVLAATDVHLDLAAAQRDLLIGAAGDPAALLLALRPREAALVIADAPAHAVVAGTEAALQVAVERPVAALGRVAHALVAGGARVLETLGARGWSTAVLAARRRDREHRDQERNED